MRTRGRTSTAITLLGRSFLFARWLLNRQVFVSGEVHRDGGAADCMPGGDPAFPRSRVEPLASQLAHGFAADLKPADAIHRDRPVARQVLDPARQGAR